MGSIFSFLLGAIVASIVMHYLQQAQHKQTVRSYETQLRTLQRQHQQALNEARSIALHEHCVDPEQRVDKEPDVEPTQPQTHHPQQYPGKGESSEILQSQSRSPSPHYPNRSSQPRSRPKKSYSVEGIRKTHSRAYKP